MTKSQTAVSGLAWTETGSHVVATTTAGDLARFDKNGGETNRVVTGMTRLRRVQRVPGTQSVVVLADDAEALILDSDNEVTSLPLSTTLGLRDLCVSEEGDRIFVCRSLGSLHT